MQIGTCISEPGKITKGHLFLCKYKSQNLKIPIIIAEGEELGKTIFISAGVHGDEVNGIEIVHNFISTIDPAKLQGTIIFLPILNPWGFNLDP